MVGDGPLIAIEMAECAEAPPLAVTAADAPIGVVLLCGGAAVREPKRD